MHVYAKHVLPMNSTKAHINKCLVFPEDSQAN